MQELINFLRTDNYLLILNVLIIVLLIGFIALLVSNMKLKEKYKKFMKKLGNGKDIEEDLSNFMYKVDRVEKQNAEITNKQNDKQCSKDCKWRKCGINRSK